MKTAVRTFVLGGVLGAGILGGGALAVAQTTGTGTIPPATATPGTTPGTAPGSTAPGSTTPGTQAKPADPANPGTPADPSRPGGPGCDDRGHGGHRGRAGKLMGQREEDLAAELGITVDKLRDAQKAAHQAVEDQMGEPVRPSTRPPSDEDKAKVEADRKARRELMDKTLADKLGITVDRLKEARLAVAKKHLDQAVKDGRLTQQEADQMLQDLKDGKLPAGPGGGPGFGRGHRGGPGGGHYGGSDDGGAGDGGSSPGRGQGQGGTQGSSLRSGLGGRSSMVS